MKITIDIKTDNAAFKENDSEIFAILRKVCSAVGTHCEREGSLQDSNGNTVGKFKVTGK